MTTEPADPARNPAAAGAMPPSGSPPIKAYGAGDPALAAYVEAVFAPEDDALRAARVRSAAAGLPTIQVGAMDARHLEVVTRAAGAVKAVEIGDGFAAASLRGEDNADPMRPGHDGMPDFLANHAGGIAGGISTGQPVRVRVAFKPTSSILIPVETVTRPNDDGNFEASEIITKGRHDPCVGIRGVPVVESMMALVLADQKMLHRAQCG